MFRASVLVLIALLAATAAMSGCVRRTITIDSSPRGALVWLNDREIGRTPVRTEFLYYGEYDVRLEHGQAEPTMTSGKAAAPWWETVPLDLIAEVLPGQRRSEIRWRYDLPPRDDDPAALEERARRFRAGL